MGGGSVGVPGKGLIEGLKVTAKTLARRSVTEQYPDVQPTHIDGYG